MFQRVICVALRNESLKFTTFFRGGNLPEYEKGIS